MSDFWPFWTCCTTEPNDRIVIRGSIYPISRVADTVGAFIWAGNEPKSDFLKINCGSSKRRRLTTNGRHQCHLEVKKTLFSSGISSKLEDLEVLWNFLGAAGAGGRDPRSGGSGIPDRWLIPIRFRFTGRKKLIPVPY